MPSPPIRRIIDAASALFQEQRSAAATEYLQRAIGDAADWSDTAEFAELAALWSKCEEAEGNNLQAHAMAATCLAMTLSKLKATPTHNREVLLDLICYHHRSNFDGSDLKQLCEVAIARFSELSDNGAVFVIEAILSSLAYRQGDVTEAVKHTAAAASFAKYGERQTHFTVGSFEEFMVHVTQDLYYNKEDYRNAKVFAETAAPFVDAAAFDELRGHILLRLDEPALALEAYDAAWRKGERRAGLLTNRAAAMRATGRSNEARTILTDAVQQRPREGRLHLQLASLLFELDQFAEVVAVCSTVLGEGAPAPPTKTGDSYQNLSSAAYFRSLDEIQLLTELRLVRMQALIRMDRLAEADTDLSQILASGNEIAAARALRSAWQSNWGPEGTIDRLLQLAPRDHEARLSRATARLQRGDVTGAIEDARAILDNDMDPQSAIEILNLLIDKRPDDLTLRAQRGRAYLLRQWPKHALNDLKIVVEHGVGLTCRAAALSDRGLAWILFAEPGIPPESTDPDEMEELAWARRDYAPRVIAALRDLGGCTFLAESATVRSEAIRCFCWLLDRTYFAFQGSEAFGEALRGFTPEDVREHLSAAEAARERAGEAIRRFAWQDAIGASETAQQEFNAAGLTVVALRMNLFIADLKLRTYQLAEALSHVDAANLLLGEAGRPLTVSLDRMHEKLRTSNRGHFGLELEYLPIYGYCLEGVQTQITTMRAAALSRLGRHDDAFTALGDVDRLIAEATEEQGVVPPQRIVVAVTRMHRDAGELGRAVRLLENYSALFEDADEYDKMQYSTVKQTILAAMSVPFDPPPVGMPDGSDGCLPAFINKHVAQRDFDEALAAMDQARPLLQNAWDRLTFWNIKATLHADASDHVEALRSIREAIDASEEIYTTLGGSKDRTGWQSKRAYLYDRAVKYALSADDPRQAFELAEQARSRILAEDIVIRSMPCPPTALGLFGRLGRLRQRASALQQLGKSGKPVEAYQLRALGLTDLISDDSGVDALRLGRETIAVGRDIANAEAELERQYRLAYQDKLTVVADFSEIVRLIREDEGLLADAGTPKRLILCEFFVFEERAWILIVRSDHTVPIVRDLGDLPEIIETPEISDLMVPIVEVTAPGDIIALVPHGRLHALPLHNAVLDDGVLVERNPIFYAPSASLIWCGRRNAQASPPSRACVLADPAADLPFSRAEATMVSEFLQTSVWAGAAATLQNLRAAIAERPDALHLSCHGWFDESQPMQSGLSLIGASGQEALLTAEELKESDFAVRLVVLSACVSGRVSAKPGEEVYGVARALLQAGASSLVATVSDIPDIVGYLLAREFYRGWVVERLSKVEALQRAHIFMRRQTCQQIYDWANRELTQAGDDEARIPWLLAMMGAAQRADDIAEAARIGTELMPLLKRVDSHFANELCDTIETVLPGWLGEATYTPRYDTHRFTDPDDIAGFILLGDWR